MRRRSETRWNGTTSPSTAISRRIFRKHFSRTTIRRPSMLLTFGTFGLAFLARPIGGVVLGAYADRHGRKASLMISIVLMTARHARDRFHADLRDIGILAPIAVLDGASGAGIFGRRRIRKFDGVSGGASAGSPRVCRELAICEPGPEQRCWRPRLASGSRHGWRLPRCVVGLAHSIFVRDPGRTGRHLHPQSP